MGNATAQTHPITERAGLLTEGAQVWDQLDALLRQHATTPNLHAEGAAEWSSRDVYAHLARWIGRTVEQVQRKSAGVDWLPPLTGTDDEINERWAAEDRALTLKQAREWCIATTETLRRLIEDLSVDQWNRFGRRCMEDIDGGHYRAHIEFIEGAGLPRIDMEG